MSAIHAPMFSGGDPFAALTRVLHRFTTDADEQGRTWVADSDPVYLESAATKWPGGSGVRFELSTSRLQLSNPGFTCAGDVTIEFWYKMISTWPFSSANNQSLFSASGVTTGSLTIAIEADKFSAHRILIEPIGGTPGYIYGPAMTDTNWHFYQYVRTGLVEKLYVDGSLACTYTGSSLNALFGSNPIRVGGTQLDGLNYFPSYMDELRITDAARPVVVPIAPFPNV